MILREENSGGDGTSSMLSIAYLLIAGRPTEGKRKDVSIPESLIRWRQLLKF
jgi:hypothetical protein